MAIDVEKMLDHITNNDYSTSEIKTGKKWIDGKPIYRKVISTNITASGSWTPILTVAEIDKLISAYGKCGGWAIPCYNNSSSYGNIQLGESETVINYVNNGLTGNLNVILEYTKTTD